MSVLAGVPAYGRDYKSGKAAKQAFMEGADFQNSSMFGPDAGRYFSLEELGVGQSVTLRFKRLTGITSLKVTQAMKDQLALRREGVEE